MPNVNGIIKAKKVTIQGNGTVGKDVVLSITDDTFIMSMSNTVLMAVTPDYSSSTNDDSKILLSKNVDITGNLTIESNININGVLDATSNLISSNIDVQYLNITDGLIITSAIASNIFTQASIDISSVNGASNYASNLLFDTLNGLSNLTLSGQLSASNLDVYGTTTINGTTFGVNFLSTTYLSANNMGMYRNRIINGDMCIAQLGTSNTITSNSGATATQINTNVIDRFGIVFNSGGSVTYTQNQLITSDTPYLSGFRYSAKLEVATADSSPIYNYLTHVIEATNVNDLMWGTISGTTCIFSFYTRTNSPANTILPFVIYNGLNNNSSNTSYIGTYTVTATNVWQRVEVTIPAPSSTSFWNSGSNAGIQVMLAPYATSNIYQGTSNVWNTNMTNPIISLSNSMNLYGTVGCNIEFTGVQFEKGNIQTPFEFRPYGLELMLCQRYCELINFPNMSGTENNLIVNITGTSNILNHNYLLPYKVTKRTNTPTLLNSNNFIVSSGCNIDTVSYTSYKSDSALNIYMRGSNLTPILTGTTNSLYQLCLSTSNTTGTVAITSEYTYI